MALEVQLNAEIEKIHQYTRRENLRFNNIREEEGEDCKSLIYNVIEKDMGIDTVQVRDKRPTHTQNARTIFAQTRVEKRVLIYAFARI